MISTVKKVVASMISVAVLISCTGILSADAISNSKKSSKNFSSTTSSMTVKEKEDLDGYKWGSKAEKNSGVATEQIGFYEGNSKTVIDYNTGVWGKEVEGKFYGRDRICYRGDMDNDGKISNVDLELYAKYKTEKAKVETCFDWLLDVNDDGSLDSKDYNAIKAYLDNGGFCKDSYKTGDKIGQYYKVHYKSEADKKNNKGNGRIGYYSPIDKGSAEVTYYSGTEEITRNEWENGTGRAVGKAVGKSA